MDDLLTEEEIKPAFAPKHARIFAVCIDYIIFYFILWLFYGNLFTSGVQGNGFNFVLYDPNVIVSLLVWMVLFPLPEGFKGQTIGKKLLHVKVLSKNYSKASYGQCIVRHLFDIIDSLPLFGLLGVIICSFTKQKQRIGDLAGGTIVIDCIRTKTFSAKG